MSVKTSQNSNLRKAMSQFIQSGFGIFSIIIDPGTIEVDGNLSKEDLKLLEKLLKQSGKNIEELEKEEIKGQPGGTKGKVRTPKKGKNPAISFETPTNTENPKKARERENEI